MRFGFGRYEVGNVRNVPIQEGIAWVAGHEGRADSLLMTSMVVAMGEKQK
jgi:hypothetical protein